MPENNDKKNKSVAIIGAGFSGLTLAWYLTKLNIKVEIFESTERAGGMIKSERREGYLVESAANAILANKNLEALCEELQIEIIPTQKSSHKRYIFRQTPKQLPLRISEIGRALKGFVANVLTKKIKPQSLESVAEWSDRVFGESFTNYIIGPALGGVYATIPKFLSAKLVLSSFFNSALRSSGGNNSGSVSFKDGMQSLTDALHFQLKKQGVTFHFNTTKKINDLLATHQAVVVATSLHHLTHVLSGLSYQNSEGLKQLEMLSLQSVTVKLDESRHLKGFGCLFPENEKFNSLGVLFNNDIFESRSKADYETWILRGPIESSDKIAEAIKKDRTRLLKSSASFSILKHVKWDKALPQYDLKLEAFLKSNFFKKLEAPNSHELFSIDSELQCFYEGARLNIDDQKIYLTGNYLGGIGLAKILDYNNRLSLRIRSEFNETVIA